MNEMLINEISIAISLTVHRTTLPIYQNCGLIEYNFGTKNDITIYRLVSSLFCYNLDSLESVVGLFFYYLEYKEHSDQS